MASNSPWDDPGNNQPTIRYSTSSTRNELGPGRFMYDFPAWRSEFRVSTEPVLIRRYAGRLEGRTDPDLPYTRYLGELPRTIEFKTTSTDTMPPNRTRRGDFFVDNAGIEYLALQNHVIEDIDPSEDVNTASTLDTLYEGSGGSMPRSSENPHNILMTYYHGPSAPQGVVLSGFDIWTFKRVHCKAVVDFVLRRMWDMNSSVSEMRAPPVRAPRPAGRNAVPAQPVSSRVSNGTDSAGRDPIDPRRALRRAPGDPSGRAHGSEPR